MICPQTTQHNNDAAAGVPGAGAGELPGAGAHFRRGRCFRGRCFRGRCFRGRHFRGGMSLLELMVVVVIIALIVSIMVVGVNSARTNMRITATRATLELLETVVDEYYVQTEGYFTTTAVAEQLPAPPAAGFLQTAEGVGEIFSLTGALPRNAAGTVVDAWGRPIWFYSANVSKRPVFWSDGPDETDSSAARPWELNHPYALNDLVGYKSNVYVCMNAHNSTAGNAPAEQGTADWELTDCIGTFK